MRHSRVADDPSEAVSQPHVTLDLRQQAHADNDRFGSHIEAAQARKFIPPHLGNPGFFILSSAGGLIANQKSSLFPCAFCPVFPYSIHCKNTTLGDP
ncbi:unnamed protein product [Protopolystoma xenopodis]|uniref:Uncharacterized protein n=1 Tax=Protopolystoma xenopodis TaxID=117903 RepID=A0A448WGF7_9PLAT|nr:unnamed protein product [Protopolystoma xenopodis]